MQVETCCLLGHLVHGGSTVVDHAERAAVCPFDVVEPLVGQVTDDIVDGPALLVE